MGRFPCPFPPDLPGLRPKSRAFTEIGQSLLVNIRQGFEAERSPDGEAWEPLKSATVRQKRRRPPDPPEKRVV